jgi:hypothetical protein
MKSAISVLRRWLDLDRQLVLGGIKMHVFAKQWKVHPATAQRDLNAFKALGQVVSWRGGRSPGSGFGYYGSPPLFYCNVPTVEGQQGEGHG